MNLSILFDILDKIFKIYYINRLRLNLDNEQADYAGAFAEGNGWQKIKFDAMSSGRFVALEFADAHDGGDVASIAEIYLLDENDERLPRENWKILYADSEDSEQENHTADKLIDLQESTFWSTAQGDKFPHSVVIDMGAKHNICGIEYLPRMENGAPASVKSFKVFVKSEEFSFK